MDEPATTDGIEVIKQEIVDSSFEETSNIYSEDQSDAVEESPPPPPPTPPASSSTNAKNSLGIQTTGNISAVPEKLNAQNTECEKGPNLITSDIVGVQRQHHENEIEDMAEYDDDEGNLMIDDQPDEVNITNSSHNPQSKISKKHNLETETRNITNSAKGCGDNNTPLSSGEDFIATDDADGNDSSSEKGEKEVALEKLPRPVNELNCRQSRTYLVKLLRAANGGLNPHYGNPEMKPAFWPDYYWPWARLTDVHTKPRGMNEPLQYR